MQVRQGFWVCAVLLASFWGSRPLRAQCLPLELLDQGIATGRITLDSLNNMLDPSEWVLHRGPNPYWTHRTYGEAETPEDQTQAWVGLRRSNQQAYYDLVYKSRQRSCVTRLRADLRRRGKLRSELINCVQCEGERLVGEGYTVSIFNQKESYAAKHSTFPYVLVIRRTLPSETDSKATPGVSSQAEIP